MNRSSAVFAWYIIIGMLLKADQPIPLSDFYVVSFSNSKRGFGEYYYSS